MADREKLRAELERVLAQRTKIKDGSPTAARLDDKIARLRRQVAKAGR